MRKIKSYSTRILNRIIINNKEAEKEKNNFFIDSAVFCTLSYAVLYFLTYINETIFLRHFEINNNFVEIDNSIIFESSEDVLILIGCYLSIQYIFKYFFRDKLFKTEFIKNIVEYYIPIIIFAFFIRNFYICIVCLICLILHILLFFIVAKINKKTLQEQDLVEKNVFNEQSKFFSEHPIFSIKYIMFYIIVIWIFIMTNVIKIGNIKNDEFNIINENIINDKVLYKDVILRKYGNSLIIKTFDVKNKKFCDGFKVVNIEIEKDIKVLYSQKIKDLEK